MVTINGTNLSNPVSIIIGGVNAIPISNTGTRLVAMVMPGAVTGKVSVGPATAASSKFYIAASRTPNKQQGKKLTGIQLQNLELGSLVAISADGNTAAVCGPDNAGKSLLIFIRDAVGNWSQQGDPLPGVGAGVNQQGSRLAISADGNTLAEGTPDDAEGAGAILVFSRDAGGVWAQSAKLVATGLQPSSNFGFSVAISANGHTIVGGAPADQTDGNGGAWVFLQDAGGNWIQQGGKLSGTSTYITSKQGLAVAISANGNTIGVAGRYYNTSVSGFVEAAWIFVRQADGSWLQQGDKLNGTDFNYSNNYVKLSLALSADGNTAVEGANYNDIIPAAGCWVYTRNATGNWAMQGNKIIDSTAPNSLATSFGYSVALSADGNTLVTGGPNYNLGVGGCWVFTRTEAGIWKPKYQLLGTGATGKAEQGYSIAISADGNTMIEGGYYDNNLLGAAWVFKDSTAMILPVGTITFTALYQNKGVQLNWTGYNEINMDGYDIEKSSNGYQFSKIGNITAKNNEAANDYTWFDGLPLAGDNYYRLKAISKDGTVQYSHVVKITIGNALSSIKVYPNPVTNKTIQVQLNNADAATYTIAIYSEAGQKLYSGNYVHTGGSTTVPVRVNNLAGGIYHVEVKGANKLLSTKIIIQ